MKQERIEWTVRVINQGIRHYQRKLAHQLELRAEIEFHNGNLKCSNISNCENNIKKYEIIIADLSAVRRAIRNDKDCVKIYGTADETDEVGTIYPETYDVLVKRAKLYIDGAMGYRDLYFEAIEEHETWEKYAFTDEAMKEWDAWLKEQCLED